MPPSDSVEPTTWILAGNGTQVRYSAAEPTQFYQDSHLIRSFDEIRAVQVPDVLTLIAVSLVLTVDSGSTTLTLPAGTSSRAPLLPARVPLVAQGTTVHHLGLVPAFQHGQQHQYTVTSLEAPRRELY